MNIRKKKERADQPEMVDKTGDQEQIVSEKSKTEAEPGEEPKVPEKSKEEELQAKLDELNDKYLRLYSEFDNFRKRTIKERIDLVSSASAEIILDMLPVLDDFERAVKSSSETEDCSAIREGEILIYNKFKGILERKGLKPITAIGSEFSTDFHEAVAYTPVQEAESKNKVVDEVQKGYMLNEKVLRYTKVVIGQ
jgi:molecular chaperone GrpE